MLRSPNGLKRAAAVASAGAAALALAALLPGTAAAAPALVVLTRHGHKDRPAPQEPTNYNLSETGLLQALQLARVLPACVLGALPLHLASYGFEPESGKNARSYQTLVPLAIASGVNIRLIEQAGADSAAIGRAIMADRRYDGAALVLAWEHRHLPQLAEGLGWGAMPAVDDDDFDSLWLLRYAPPLPAAGVLPQVELLSQRQLQRRPCLRRLSPQSDLLLRVVDRLLHQQP